MLALTHSDEPPCEEVAALIARRLDDVRQRLRELRRVERAMSLAHDTCCKGGPDWCNQIERLKGPRLARLDLEPRCNLYTDAKDQVRPSRDGI